MKDLEEIKAILQLLQSPEEWDKMSIQDVKLSTDTGEIDVKVLAILDEKDNRLSPLVIFPNEEIYEKMVLKS